MSRFNPGDLSMATLNSPGVAVSVIDESFYTPAEPGTTPLVVVATAQDKTNGSGTGTALGTTKAQAGKAFRITSQRDLVDLFGVPFFEKTASGTPVHAGERNEYGLLAAYSYLGVSNSLFIVRADIDLAQLEGSATAPGAEPKAGQWWLDVQNTAWGIQEWNGAAKSAGGQKFVAKTPIVLSADDLSKVSSNAPLESVGVPGDYAVVAQSNSNVIYYYKNLDNAWTVVGSNEWATSVPAVVSTNSFTSETFSGSFLINTTNVTVTGQNISAIASAINSAAPGGVTAAVIKNKLCLFTDTLTDDASDSTLANAIVLEDISGSVLQTIGLLPNAMSAKTYYGPTLQISAHTVVPEFKSTDTQPRPSGSVWIKTTEFNSGARWRVKQWNTGTQLWDVVNAPLYANSASALYTLDRSGGGLNLPTNTVYVQYNATEDVSFESYADNTPQQATFRLWRRANAGATVIISPAVVTDGTRAGSKSFTISESVKGVATMSAAVTVDVTLAGIDTDAQTIATAINGSGLTHVKADISSNNELIISHNTGGEIRFDDTDGVIAGLFGTSANVYVTATLGVSGNYEYIASNWAPLSVATFISSASAPLSEPVDGQLWYNPEFSEVDIMVHNGVTWVGYQYNPANPSEAAIFGPASSGYGTDANGPIVSASTPAGTSWVNNQLWVSTADLENFPTIYRWSSEDQAWNLVDKTDQTSEEGILFADARYGISGETGNTAGSIKELLSSNYLDPDAPDPALYPKGMLLWNTRRSGGNVKRYNNNYIDTTVNNPRYNPLGTDGDSTENYATDRWTTASANNEDGSGTFGRKAQHAVVVAALKSVTDTSAEIRDEERRNFNLIACPGYPELLSNLVNLNIDRGITAFVVGDTPFRLPSDATSLTNWGTNANGALDNNETGIVTYDEYAAVFYPNGYTTDLSGTYAVVPASHMMLKTIALSDQVSYPWFAPAGTRRGGITNATAVGYIDAATGEFQQVSLNEGQRDTLYDIKVNPITFFNGVGLVNYGQKTRGRNASALDRINVSRLTVYLRSQLQKLARPYVFEPNDKITRDEIRNAVESLLLELVSLRAIYDFAVVCDESNNTPARIDRNELYVDVAIEPVKAVEFIYIPLRVKNTGEI